MGFNKFGAPATSHVRLITSEDAESPTDIKAKSEKAPKTKKKEKKEDGKEITNSSE